MRLLHGLDRFSEDLDFDLVRLSSEEADYLMKLTSEKLRRENIALDFYRNVTKKRAYYEFRFRALLYQLDLSSDKAEKLTIKFDFERFWQKQKREIVPLNRYGFLVNTVSIPREQILVQKLFAYTKCRQTLPRDIYDIIWLALQEVKIDFIFLKENKLPEHLLKKAKMRFFKEKKKLKSLKLKLKPFLLAEHYSQRLELFPQMLEKIQNPQALI